MAATRLEEQSHYPLAHFHLAVALALRGSISEAQIAARKGLVRDPTFTIAACGSLCPAKIPFILPDANGSIREFDWSAYWRVDVGPMSPAMIDHGVEPVGGPPSKFADHIRGKIAKWAMVG